MEVATAAGLSSTAAMLLPPDDLKAADSDVVTISFDTQREEKTRSPTYYGDTTAGRMDGPGAA